MNRARLIVLLVLAFLAVFLQAAWNTPRVWLGSHLNLVPPLVVYAALRLGLVDITALAIAAGLWQDALSINPLGISLLPLFLVGLGLQHWRDLLLREVDYAQLVLGAGASVAVPLLTLLLLLTRGQHPDLGWSTAWQFLVVAVTGGVLTPVLFRVLDKLTALFIHPEARLAPYRADREMRRGRY